MVQVEVGTETFGAVAVPAEGAERDRLFALVVDQAPGYGEYQTGLELPPGPSGNGGAGDAA